MAIRGLGFVFAALDQIQVDRCPACGNTLPPLSVRTRSLTCDEACSARWIDSLVQELGEMRHITSTETGKTYAVPTRIILEQGITHADLVTYPEVSKA